MRDKVPFSLVCIAVLAFACGPRPRSEAATERSTVKRNTPVDARAPLAPALEIDVNNGVHFSFDVVNASTRKLEVLFNDGRTHDIIVLDSLGREVWRWSDDRMFTQVVQSKVLRASDTLSFAESWTDPQPGNYVAVATLPSRNYPVEHRVAFVVH
ncbi:MAG: hypothetical protein C0503_04850 [Gemmatimonas sp.]|nr:hypothetical protein [Gemmatimonas sp.]